MALLFPVGHHKISCSSTDLWNYGCTIMVFCISSGVLQQALLPTGLITAYLCFKTQAWWSRTAGFLELISSIPTVVRSITNPPAGDAPPVSTLQLSGATNEGGVCE